MRKLGNMDNTLDPQAVMLAKSIRRAETGDSRDPYNQQGKSGEFGAYQFMPDTYRIYAKKYIGDENAQPTIENQNRIAYSFVKEKKDAGYTPAQIASMWNAGEARPDAYKENHVGVNERGVNYDTPGYVKKVSAYYNQFSGKQPSVIQETNTVEQQKQDRRDQGLPVSAKDDKAEPGFFGGLLRNIIKPFARAGASIVNAQEALSGKPMTEIFKSDFLGDITRIGKDFDPTKGLTAENIRAIKDAVGTGVDIGSLIGGGGEAKAGVEALRAGKLLEQPLLRTVGNAAKEGAVVGGLQGTGSSLEENQNLQNTLRNTALGAGLGAGTGGILGTTGGLLNKLPGKGLLRSDLEPSVEGIVASKEAQKAKDEINGILSSTKSGSNIKAESGDLINRAIESGYVPMQSKSGLLDTTEPFNKIQVQTKLGQKEKAAVIENIKQTTSIEDIRKEALEQAAQRYSADKPTLKEVTNSINNYFNDLYGAYDQPLTAKELLDLQNSKSISDFAKWERAEDEGLNNKAQWARQIYFAINNRLNKIDTSGRLAEINKDLSDLHQLKVIFDPKFRGSLHGRKIRLPETRQFLMSLLRNSARIAGAGFGAHFGGPTGAIAAEFIEPKVSGLLRGRSSLKKVK